MIYPEAFYSYESPEQGAKLAIYNHEVNTFIHGYDVSMLMQCTAINSADGSLIWEGDIVDIVDKGFSEPSLICEVMWDDYLSRWVVDFLNIDDKSALYAFQCKIIGHSYDGKEYK